jgi:hypothetical protein
MAADVTGDGRQDLVYVHFRNPGYEVYTLAAQPAGGFKRSSVTVTPGAELPGLTNPNTGSWMLLDVGGGPGGAPDGRADLVLVDRDNTTLRIYTLLSTAAGWTAKVDQAWRVDGKPAPYDDPDVRGWRPANLNHDGRTDLVHVVALAVGVRVEYLVANGDGTWSSGAHTYFTASSTYGALAGAEAGAFLLTDVDGNGLTDLVYVQSGSTTVVRTLLADGNLSWTEQTASVSLITSPGEAHAFRAMEYNGDGMRDLALIRSSPTGCLRVTVLASTGGSWTPPEEAPVPVGCSPIAGLRSLDNVRLVDVNQDGRDDVLHLARYHADDPRAARTSSPRPPCTCSSTARARPGRLATPPWRWPTPTPGARRSWTATATAVRS